MFDFIFLQSRELIRRLTSDQAWRCGLSQAGGGDLHGSSFSSPRRPVVGVRNRLSI